MLFGPCQRLRIEVDRAVRPPSVEVTGEEYFIDTRKRQNSQGSTICPLCVSWPRYCGWGCARHEERSKCGRLSDHVTVLHGTRQGAVVQSAYCRPEAFSIIRGERGDAPGAAAGRQHEDARIVRDALREWKWPWDI